MSPARRLTLLTILGVTAILVLTACAGGRDEPEALRVGLVVDHNGIDDRSFNAASWAGVQTGTDALDGLYSFSVAEMEGDFKATIESLIGIGYEVIVTIGFPRQEVTAEAARDNPDVFFIGVDQAQSGGDNIAGLVFPNTHAGFLAGALAAHMSETNSVAAVFGPAIPPVAAFGHGFELGARLVNPDIPVIIRFHPGGVEAGFSDPDWGAETAKDAIDADADVIFGAGGFTGNGALLEAARHEGVLCIGVDEDQWESLPAARPCLISSAVKRIPQGVHGLIVESQSVAPRSGTVTGGVALAPFHDFDTAIPAEVKADLDRLAAGLRDGSIVVG